MRPRLPPTFANNGISFDLACLTFADPFALTAQDRAENGEYRWRTLGLVEGCLLLLVAHTVADADGTEIVRIISARKATRQERRSYEQENH
jgi:uncharacterized protein